MAFSCQLKAVSITLTIICLIDVADGRSPPPLTELSIWRSSYSSTVRKSDPSVVRRIRLVIWAPTIDVIAANIASFTSINAIRAMFCLSALSCALAFVVILGATMLIFELAACTSEMDCLLTSLLLIVTLDF